MIVPSIQLFGEVMIELLLRTHIGRSFELLTYHSYPCISTKAPNLVFFPYQVKENFILNYFF